jgi:hypothetical protein
MYTDQTNIFRTILADKLGDDPTEPSPSSQESSRAASPTGIRNRFGGRKDDLKRKRRKVPREEEEQDGMRREFLAEAYRIVSIQMTSLEIKA